MKFHMHGGRWALYSRLTVLNSSLFDLVGAPRARFALALVCGLLAPACGNKDDDDRPRKQPEPPAAAAPPTVATVAAEPPAADPAPPPPSAAPPAAPPGAPGKPASTSTAAPKKGGATPPIPTHLVPKQIQPYVPKDLPKVPANLPLPQ